ncbi:hypothetical protein [Xanthomonas oryzae]|uniref:hypothetical protein n=1 Tax=Xanthomonas oryzae TaxID=347 RepID=UPI001F459E6B|nr:hypothetical protein [Xanthomonas oryzae]
MTQDFAFVRDSIPLHSNPPDGSGGGVLVAQMRGIARINFPDQSRRCQIIAGRSLPNGMRIGAGGVDAPSAVGTPNTTRTCMPTSTLSREEFDALAVVAKAHRNLLFQTFNGTRLSVGKRGYASGNAFGSAVAIYEFKDGLNLQAQHLS